MNDAFIIGIPIYNGVDLMDVAAPFELFSWMAASLKGQRVVSVYLLAETNRVVLARMGADDRPNGFKLVPHKRFADVDQLNLLWVPGGAPGDLMNCMKDQGFISAIQKWSKTADYVTSVCEGALLLAAAGLLDGHWATTHWAFVQYLKLFPKVKVVDGHPRFVVDPVDPKAPNRPRIVTGGGISSGLDEALELIGMIAGYQIAEQTQRTTQYYPSPPINAQLPPLSPEIPGMAETVREILRINATP